MCGKDFTLSHALSCSHGVFPIIQHNEIIIQDLTTSLMLELCHDVQVEPHLHPLSGEIMCHCAVLDDDAQVDIRASGFWRCLHHHTFNVRVFNCFTASKHFTPLATTFHKHVPYKGNVCEVEHDSFTPLVFTSSGTGKATITTYKHLAHLLSEK